MQHALNRTSRRGPGSLALLAAAAAPFVALLAGPAGPAPATAQGADPTLEIDAHATVTSRFIYRGLMLGDAAQVQPSLTATYGRLDAGVWGSHPLTEDEGTATARPYKEAIAWLAYRIPFAGGTLIPYVQSHYAVSLGGFLEGESHFVQTQLSWVGPEEVPLDLMAGVVVVNDPDNSVYLEAGYRTAVGDLGFRFFVGGTPAESPFNGTDEAAFTNVGVTTTWPLLITDRITLTIGSQFIVNPHTGEVYPVLSLGV